MTEKRFTKQEVYDGINRYQINDSNFIIEILDDGIPMHYSTIVNRLNEQHKTISRLEKENEQIRNKKERYKRLSEIRQQQINNRILTIKEFINNCSDNKVRSILKELFYSEVNEYDLSSENRKLLNENEQLKHKLKSLNDNFNHLKRLFDEIEEPISDELLAEYSRIVVGDLND